MAVFYLNLHAMVGSHSMSTSFYLPALENRLNFLFFRQQAAFWQLVGVVLSIFGVVVTSTHGDPLGFFSGSLNRGDALMLLASVFYAGYTISLRWRPQIHWLSFLFVIGCGAVLILFPMAVWEINAKGFEMPSTKGWLLLGYTVLFPTVVSQLAFARGVELIGGNRAGLFINLVPVFGSLLAILLIGESFQIYHAIGMALVLGGIFLAERSAVQ